MKVLLTNDDGIGARGLQCLRRALLGVPGIELAVIAPSSNRSATARSITTQRPIWVQEVPFEDGTVGYATDGTPADCVRFAGLGLVEDFTADLVVSGINHGANLGDDIAYSGTVAAAFEGLLMGIPAIAVSQQSGECDFSFRRSERYDFTAAAGFVARLVEEIDELPLPAEVLLNVNVPGRDPAGVELCRIGKRIYRERLSLDSSDEEGRRSYWIYGADHGYVDEPGTDLAAVAAGRIAVTPIAFDLVDNEGLAALGGYDLERLLAPAAQEVE